MRPMAYAASLSLVGLLTGSTNAQVITPPPPPPEPKEEFVPPPPPAPRQAQPTRRAPTAAQRDASLPELPYRRAQWGMDIPADGSYDGPVKRYPRPMHVEILPYNPTTTRKMVPQINEVLDERTKALEPLVIEHIGTVQEIMDGMLMNLNLSDIEGFQAVAESIKPLRLEKNLTRDLRDRRIMTRTQAGFQDKLIREYQAALREEFAAAGDEGGAGFIQFIFHDELLEAVNVFEGLLLESTLRMDEVLNGLDVPTGLTQDLRGLKATREELADESSWTDRIDAVRLAWRGLTNEQKRAFLERVIETRGEGESPIRREITTDNPSKTYQEGSGEIKINPGTPIPNTGGETDISIKEKQAQQDGEQPTDD